MIISPPFLPSSGVTPVADQINDPMMDIVDKLELEHGIYPIAFDRRWHTGIHLMPDARNERVRAIADGDVVAYRVCKKAVDDGQGNVNSNAGFVLLKHQTDTGDGRSITFYSLYMHLLELDGYAELGVSYNALPEFLRTASPGEAQTADAPPQPAQHGGALKVYRKDMLGLAGRCQGQRHIHFEIFMLPEDFKYFDNTQLGNEQPTTPSATDVWGHSYYIIPAGQSFLAKPSGSNSHGVLNKVAFELLQSGSNSTPLHVETYFHQGTKFTNTWSVAADGTRTLLTPQPVQESGYEYGLYDRATKLYEDCPSDGYELLRFGRILSPQPGLAAGAARTTWMRMTFASGQEGYLDVNSDSIVKLSDADFPFFTGWRKISAASGTTPFTNDGMCSVAELNKIVENVESTGTDPNEVTDEDALAAYVKNNDALRAQLKGFVCHAPTEWDSSQNETRYAALNAPDGFYGKQQSTNPNGYADFLSLLKKFQFWDQVGLPSDEVWFFHPLQFIRHFRRCGWLHPKEISQCIPTSLQRLYHADMVTDHISWHSASSRGEDWAKPFSLSTRKYGVDNSKLRLLQFFSHVIPETGCLSQVVEGNGQNATYAPYWGRGLIQLTGIDNYTDYGKFRKLSSATIPSQYSDLHWDPDTLIAKDNHGNHNSENCADSACFYIAKRSGMLGHMDAGYSQSQAITVSEDVNGHVAIENLNGLELRLQGVTYLRKILLDEVIDEESVSITFDWRRNSSKEPKLDAQGHPVMHGNPPKPVMIFYKKTWTIQVSMKRQKP